MNNQQGLNSFVQNRREEYLKDVAIAEQVVRSLKLDQFRPLDDLLCDIYCIPSHNHQAFYVNLYQSENIITMIYAKPIITARDGNKIVMYRFADSVKIDELHPGYGNIYCGIKRLPIDAVNDLIDTMKALPSISECENGGACIDGVYTVIRTNPYKRNSGEFAYYDVDSMKAFQKLSDKQKEKLNNLYLEIESIIGNTAQQV